jgi:V/A-type H+-transporting ATPase subunit K
MVRTDELGIKMLRPAILLLTIVMALCVIVGFAAGQYSEPQTTDLDSDSTEVEIPNQFGAEGNGNETINTTAEAENTQAMIAIGAALAIGIAGIGSATGIGIAGASGIGATAEKPDRFGKSMVLQAMPMTQGIYGLLIAILLLMGGGLLGGGGGDVGLLSKPFVGISAVAIGLAVGLTGISAIGQGITASASIGGSARNPEVFSKGMIFTVMSETLAIFGLLTGILIMVGVGLL